MFVFFLINFSRILKRDRPVSYLLPWFSTLLFTQHKMGKKKNLVLNWKKVRNRRAASKILTDLKFSNDIALIS